MKLKRLVISATLAVTLLPAKADEGMWLLPLLKQQNMETMKKMGLNLDPDQIYSSDTTALSRAVVIFGAGCTGEIISPEGLLITNHHCGYGPIQQLSTVTDNYLLNGFWASAKDKELPVTGLKVRFIDKIEDVTDYVKTALADDPDVKPMDFLSPRYLNGLARKKAGETYLNEHPWLEVEIKPFYGGNKYYLFIKKVYSDIRLVGTPPSSIGKFGADTDNWMWPRHTGDFSLFRVYMDKEGNPADYSKENVPLRPEKYLPISLKGIKENDFAMIIGFPGTTNRYYTSWDVKQRRDIQNSVRIRIREIRQQEMLDEMLADPQVRIQYASKYARSSNYWKNSIGMNRGIDHLKVMEQKQAQEEVFRTWAAQNGKTEYLRALERIRDAVSHTDSLSYQFTLLSEALYTGIEFSHVPYQVDSLITALNHKNKDITENLLYTLEQDYKAFADKDYNPAVDKRIAKAMIKAYVQDIPAKDRPGIFAYIDKNYKGNYDKFIDDAFESSIFATPENFGKFIKKPTVKSLENDLMIRFARSVAEKRKALEAEIQPYTHEYSTAMNTYIAGLLEMRADKPNYPDANFTIRLTYGSILPYDPADAITYHYYTTLKGVMEKENPDNWEFIVPDRLKELYEKKDFGPYAMSDGEMPCNFISTNDITGGNSGSPVINGDGELIGLAFDGNWEAMSGDIIFEKDLQRTINVDIRYVLFIIDKFAGAGHLIDEMTLVR